MDKNKKINIRRRILISSFFASLSLFFLTSPIITTTFSLIDKPKIDTFVEIGYNLDKSIELRWAIDLKDNVKGYFLRSEGSEISIFFDKDKSYSKVDLSAFKEGILNFQLVELDLLNRESDPFEFEVSLGKPSVQVFTINSSINEAGDVITGVNWGSRFFVVFFIAVLVSLTVSLFGAWIFQFNFINDKVYILLLYTGFVNFAYLMFTQSILVFSGSIFQRFIFSILFVIIFFVFLYFLYLTINILYNALSYELPLEQAAKASQFLFSLISAFLVIMYTYTNFSDVISKAVVISLIMLPLSFGNISMVRSYSLTLSFLKSLSITIVSFLSIVILSIWPVNQVLVIISISVIFYILLSVSIESTQTITKSIWNEYIILIILLAVVYLYSSNWGVYGVLWG